MVRKMQPQVRQLAVVILLFAELLVVVGCGRRVVGSPISEEHIPQIVAGKTTKAEILKLFGAPYDIQSKGDEEVLTYLYGRAYQFSFIFWTEVQEKADILAVYIGPNGVVSNYVFSKGVSAPDILKPPARR